MPIGSLFIRISRVQDFCIRPGARNNLQANGQSAFGESAGDGNGGQSGQIEWRGETCEAAGLLDGIVAFNGGSSDRCSGEDQ